MRVARSSNCDRQEALSECTNRALHLALRLCPIGPGGAGQELVRGEPEDSAFTRPPPAGSSDSTTARIWSNSSSSGTPPNWSKALSSASIRTAIVCRIEVQPQQPGVAEDDHQGMAPAPGKRERPESTWPWCPGGVSNRTGASTGCAAGSQARSPSRAVAARVARRPDLVEQPLRRQLWERLETRVDDRLVGINL